MRIEYRDTCKMPRRKTRQISRHAGLRMSELVKLQSFPTPRNNITGGNMGSALGAKRQGGNDVLFAHKDDEEVTEKFATV